MSDDRLRRGATGRVVICTVGMGARAGPWYDSRQAWKGHGDARSAYAKRDAIHTVVRGHLSAARGYRWESGRLVAVEAGSPIVPELSGMFVPGAPLYEDIGEAVSLKVPDATHVVLVVPADGNQKDVHAEALLVLGCIVDDVTITDVAADALDWSPRVLDAGQASGELLLVNDMNTLESEQMERLGLASFAGAVATVLSAYRDYEVYVCATGGTKSLAMALEQLVGLVKGIAGDTVDERGRRRVADVASLTTVFDGAAPPQALRHLIAPGQLPYAWWSAMMQGQSAASTLGERPAGSFLVRAGAEGSSDVEDSRVARWLYTLGDDEGFVIECEDDTLRQRRRDHVKSIVERVKNGEARAASVLRSLPAKLLPDKGDPNVGRLFVAESLLARRSDPELAATGYLPEQELVHRIAVAKLKLLVKADPQGDKQPGADELIARAVSAVEDWCRRLAPAPPGRARRIIADLDGRTDQLTEQLVALSPALAARNRMLEQLARTSLLPRYRLAKAVSLVDDRLYYAGIGVLFAPLVLGLLAGFSPALCDILLGWPGDARVSGGCAALGCAAAALVGGLLMTRAAKRKGALATDPLILRLAGACAIGSIAIVGLSDVVRELVKGIADGRLPGAAIATVGAALSLTLIYLRSERAPGPRDGGLRDSVLVATVGLGYSTLFAFVVTPLAIQLAYNDKHGAAFIEAAYDRDVSLVATLVVAALALLLGVLSQVFWSDRTAVDPL